MGQYYYTFNLDKKEYIHPHYFGDGLKLMEFGLSGMGTMTGLAILLADGNGRGGGDLHRPDFENDPIVGRWAGDRIVASGDYADEGKFTNDPNKNLMQVADEEYKNISADVLYAMLDDSYLLKEYKRQMKDRYSGRDLLQDLILIKECADEELPLLIGKLETDDGKRILEQEMKRRLGNGSKKSSSVSGNKRARRRSPQSAT